MLARQTMRIDEKKPVKGRGAKVGCPFGSATNNQLKQGPGEVGVKTGAGRQHKQTAYARANVEAMGPE